VGFNPFGGGLDLTPIDDRAVGRDAEVPYRLLLLGRVAGHQAGEALLVARTDRLDEGIADDEDRGPGFLSIARRARAGAQSVLVGLPRIDDAAPDARRLDAGDDVVMMRGADIDAEVTRLGGVAIGVDQPRQDGRSGHGVEEKRYGQDRQHRAGHAKRLPHDGFWRPRAIARSPPLGLS
jgi:hypothetical protein